MKNLKIIFTFFLISILTISPLITLADGSVGNVNMVVDAPSDFNDVIVIDIASEVLENYSYTIEKEVELSPYSMYMNAITGIPAGTYSVYTWMYKSDDATKTPYQNPDYTLQCTSIFALLDGQNYDLKLLIIPTVQVGTETALPVLTVPPIEDDTTATIISTPAPTATPTGAVSQVGSLLSTIIRGSWFTILLFLIAGGIWLFIKVRKSIYKE